MPSPPGSPPPASATEELRHALEATRLFDGLSDAERDEVLTRGQVIELAADTELLAHPPLAAGLFVVLDGVVEVRRAHRDEVRVERLVAGSRHGEASIVTGRPESLSAVALTPVRIAVWDHAFVRRALETNPRVGVNLAAMLVERLDERAHRLARVSLLVLDDSAGDTEREATRSLVTAVSHLARRTVVLSLHDELPLAQARELPAISALADAPDLMTRAARELDDSDGSLWSVPRDATAPAMPRVRRVLQRLARACDQVMILGRADDAAALRRAGVEVTRTVWITPEQGRPPPGLPADELRVLQCTGEPPRTVGQMRVVDQACGGKAFRAGGQRRDARGLDALARDLAGQRIGLALGSGAARGFAHIGVLERLHELGLPIDASVGSSAGSGVGSVWSFGAEPDRIEEDFAALQTHALRWTVPLRSLLSGEALGRHLRQVADGRGFDDASYPIAVVAVDLYESREECFTEGDLPRCVLASCAIPGVYPPVKLGERWYVDGGVLDPVPTRFVRPLGADVVIGVDIGAVGSQEPTGRGPRLLETLRHSARTMHARIAERSRAAADIVLRPSASGPAPGIRGYHLARDWRRHGRDAVDRMLPELRALLPWLAG